MKKQSLIHEIFWLRSLACLAVTFGHAIHNGHMIYEAETVFHPPVYIFSMAVLFGVPVFVFISEFLLANKYHTSVPKGFMKKG
ncbi:hypothetical protein JNUCC1_00706 [Lentibacillus sp. JNUCC-1]|uniref:acyltransferase family protein n=1 Tax=Lentibacillus sp. JNUCC-1 TaxID=2654513 RepID=UPI0013259154|nr:acyltransferase family protein [Lentibacillus sp. JNUCC-1]MUV36902.1 hypothetical protein [Lentibacillus sp. JNUCC-1]